MCDSLLSAGNIFYRPGDFGDVEDSTGLSLRQLQLISDLHINELNNDYPSIIVENQYVRRDTIIKMSRS